MLFQQLASAAAFLSRGRQCACAKRWTPFSVFRRIRSRNWEKRRKKENRTRHGLRNSTFNDLLIRNRLLTRQYSRPKTVEDVSHQDEVVAVMKKVLEGADVRLSHKNERFGESIVPSCQICCSTVLPGQERLRPY